MPKQKKEIIFYHVYKKKPKTNHYYLNLQKEHAYIRTSKPYPVTV